LVVLAFACMSMVACEESGVAALTVTKESASESFTLDDVQAMPAEEGRGE
jgi:hypothetical protein